MHLARGLAVSIVALGSVPGSSPTWIITPLHDGAAANRCAHTLGRGALALLAIGPSWLLPPPIS